MMTKLGLPPTKTSFLESLGFPAPWIQWLSDLRGIVNGKADNGPTANRPTTVSDAGFMYYDTTIGKPVFARTTSPTTWFDSNGNPA